MRIIQQASFQIAEPAVAIPRQGQKGRTLSKDIDAPAASMLIPSWGWLPALSLLCGCGLMLVAIAFTWSRAARAGAEPLFWGGLAVLVIPVTVRLAMVDVRRRERIGLVILLGLTLYLVKVMHSPVAFTFPDEMNQIYNTNQILQGRHLFHPNFLLPATPLYPGIATVTSAFAAISGLPVFTAGVVVMAGARLVLILALYLLYEVLSGSSRLAGIAAVLYMGNSNFIYYIAESSYESLALSLAVLFLFIVARRQQEAEAGNQLGLTVAALLSLGAVVISHHMTAYAVVAFMVAVATVYHMLHKGQGRELWGIALIALVATLGWLVYVATLTLNYLSPVFLGTVRALLGAIAREESGRALFRSSTGYVAPIWERVVALGAVLLLLLGLPFGLLQTWRRYRSNAFVLVLAATALGYFGMLGLRFFPAGWEISNRSSEFLFVGLSFTVAAGIVEFWIRRTGLIKCMLTAGYVAVIIAGGFISGWWPPVRLARPYEVAVGTRRFQPQGVFTAKWARRYLGVDNRIASDPTNAGLLLAYGDQQPLAGGAMGIQAMLSARYIDRTVIQILQYPEIRYVLVDRRIASRDKLVGIYFDRLPPDSSQASKTLLDPDVYRKFDRQKQVSRLYDSGDIVIYDVHVLSGVQAKN